MNLNEMAEAYQSQMGQEGHDYYAEHGIDPKVVTRHRLGWISEPLSQQHQKWQGMAVVPYVTAGGLVVALRAGVFEAESANRFDLGYVEHRFPLTSPRLRIYNVGNAMPGLRTNTVHMVERVLDVLRLRSEGERAVAIPGYQNFHDWWAELFQHSEVVVHHDHSKPEAVNAVTELLRKRRITFVEQAEKAPTVVEAG